MRTLKRVSTLAACYLCSLLLSHPARADDAPAPPSAPPAQPVEATTNAAATPAPPTSDDRADTLFAQAVELMKADRCADAVPVFLESQALDPSAATLLNLGTCYARLGRKATAWKTYRRAAETALAEKNAPLHERATQAMAILGPSLTKLQIVAPRDAAPLSIRVNGEVIPDYVGLPIPLDPGENVIEAAAPGHEPWRRSVNASTDLGATIVVQVPELRPVPPPFQPVQEPPRNDYRVPAALVGGAGIAAIIVGSVFGLSANSTYNDSDPYCRGNACTAPGITLRDDARSKATAATVTISVGLVAAAVGTVLWFVSPHAAAQSRASVGQVWTRTSFDDVGVRVEAVR